MRLPEECRAGRAGGGLVPGHEEGDFSSEGVKSRLEAELWMSSDGKLETLQENRYKAPVLRTLEMEVSRVPVISSLCFSLLTILLSLFGVKSTPI